MVKPHLSQRPAFLPYLGLKPLDRRSMASQKKRNLQNTGSRLAENWLDWVSACRDPRSRLPGLDNTCMRANAQRLGACASTSSDHWAGQSSCDLIEQLPWICGGWRLGGRAQRVLIVFQPLAFGKAHTVFWGSCWDGARPPVLRRVHTDGGLTLDASRRFVFSPAGPVQGWLTTTDHNRPTTPESRADCQ